MRPYRSDHAYTHSYAESPDMYYGDTICEQALEAARLELGVWASNEQICDRALRLQEQWSAEDDAGRFDGDDGNDSEDWT